MSLFDLQTNENHLSKYDNIPSLLQFDSSNKRATTPDVTIAIPTFKRPELLIEAVTSVVNQKTDANFEIIIVDNDDSLQSASQIKEELKHFDTNIRYYVNQENIGMFGNWNRCVSLASADLITILSDDDFLQPNWLQSVITAKSDEVGYVKVQTSKFANIDEISLSELSNPSTKIRTLDLDSLFWGNINPGPLGILFETKKVKEIGGFNELHFPSADYDFLCRYTHRFGGIDLRLELANYRMLVNESLKISALTTFIEHDFHMRQAFYLTESNRKCMMMLIRIAALKTIRKYHKVNSELDMDMLISKYNINHLDKIISSCIKPKNLFKLLRQFKLI